MRVRLIRLNKCAVGVLLTASVLSGCATQSAATLVPIARPTAIIATKAPIPTLDASQISAQPTDLPVATGNSADVQGSTAVFNPASAPPTITASGPTLASKVTNAQAFNKNVPETVGVLKRIDAQSAATTYGSVLHFRTDDGAVYQVVLWITLSAQDALTRYQIETNAISSKQPLKVGDEAILTASGPVLAEVRYRNMVLIISRPDAKDTVPHKPLTDDQVIGFVNTLFKAIPQS